MRLHPFKLAGSLLALHGFLCAQAQVAFPSVDFGNNGTTLIQNVGAIMDIGIAETVEDPQGRLFSVGFYDDGISHGFVQCFAQDGTISTSFGTNGRYITPDSLGELFFVSAAVRPDGRILLIDLGAVTPPYRVTLVQLMPDGTPDPEFGMNGIADVGCDVYLRAQDLLLSPDGSAYIGGMLHAWPYVVHIAEDGSLDTNFGEGTVAFPMPVEYEGVVSELAYSPGGYITMVGSENAFTCTNGFVAAIDLAGDPVSWFGQGGHTMIDNSPLGSEIPRCLKMATDGALVVTGMRNFNDGRSRFVLRLQPDGTPDTEFGTNGVLDIVTPGAVSKGGGCFLTCFQVETSC
ncbi:MAG: hypothetical protein IPO56_16485 [Flavobacteriales bacterium]|nr:hypothetical protein [Flavobacteriales bacterium]